MTRYLPRLLFVAVFFATPHAKAAEPVVTLSAAADGSVEIEGQNFRDGRALRLKLKEVKHRKPKPVLKLATAQNIDFKALGRASILLEKAGVIKVGFLTEPPKR